MNPSESEAVTVYDPACPTVREAGPFIELQVGGLLGMAFTIKLKEVELFAGVGSDGEPETVIKYVPGSIEPVFVIIKDCEQLGVQGLFERLMIEPPGPAGGVEVTDCVVPDWSVTVIVFEPFWPGVMVIFPELDKEKSNEGADMTVRAMDDEILPALSVLKADMEDEVSVFIVTEEPLVVVLAPPSLL